MQQCETNDSAMADADADADADDSTVEVKKSSLAIQLQQVIQNLEVSNRTVEVQLGSAPMQDCGGEVDPLKDPVLNYISNMLMDEDADDSSGYQAVAKQLSALVSESCSSGGDDKWMAGDFCNDSPGSVTSATLEQFDQVSDEVSDQRIQEVLGLLEKDLFPKPQLTHPETTSSQVAAANRVTMETGDEEEEMKDRQALHCVLLECAQAVAADNMDKAYKIVTEIRDIVSPHGTGSQRMGYYFSEALVARITGTGGLLYKALSSNNRPSTNEMHKAYRLFENYCPNLRITHFFSNQTILNAAMGAKRVHIVDYGILYGFQWPWLIKAFSQRPGGPPHLRITGIEFPQPGFKPVELVEETGRKLEKYAMEMNVPFKFHAIATRKWEDVEASWLYVRHEEEVVIVNSMLRLRHTLDETVLAESPRKVVLARIRSINPKLFIQVISNVNYSVPMFTSRFREAMEHYCWVFDAIAKSVPKEHPERHLIEQEIMGREILNIVGCEGSERVERDESYKQWQSRCVKAGFEQLEVDPDICAKARAMLVKFDDRFGVGQDGKWLMVGWNGRILQAMSTWQPK